MERPRPESPDHAVRTQDPQTDGGAETLALTTLLDCVSAVLKCPVAPTDHFLDLDGDSLKALRLVALLGTRGYRLDLDDLFEEPDLAALARRLTVVTADN